MKVRTSCACFHGGCYREAGDVFEWHGELARYVTPLEPLEAEKPAPVETEAKAPAKSKSRKK